MQHVSYTRRVDRGKACFGVNQHGWIREVVQTRAGQSLRITKHSGLERTHKDHQVQLLALQETPPQESHPVLWHMLVGRSTQLAGVLGGWVRWSAGGEEHPCSLSSWRAADTDKWSGHPPGAWPGAGDVVSPFCCCFLPKITPCYQVHVAEVISGWWDSLPVSVCTTFYAEHQRTGPEWRDLGSQCWGWDGQTGKAAPLGWYKN